MWGRGTRRGGCGRLNLCVFLSLAELGGGIVYCCEGMRLGVLGRGDIVCVFVAFDPSSVAFPCPRQHPQAAVAPAPCGDGGPCWNAHVVVMLQVFNSVMGMQHIVCLSVVSVSSFGGEGRYRACYHTKLLGGGEAAHW